MDWRQLLQDKRVRYGGIGVAALAGVWTLYHRFRSTGSTQSDAVPQASQTTGSTGSIAATYPNSTGTDVAYWVGQYDEKQQAAMQRYLAQLEQDILARLPTANSPTPTPKPTPKPTGPKAPSPSTKPKPPAAAKPAAAARRPVVQPTSKIGGYG